MCMQHVRSELALQCIDAARTRLGTHDALSQNVLNETLKAKRLHSVQDGRCCGQIDMMNLPRAAARTCTSAHLKIPALPLAGKYLEVVLYVAPAMLFVQMTARSCRCDHSVRITNAYLCKIAGCQADACMVETLLLTTLRALCDYECVALWNGDP
jgi:hypothetical protein